MRKLAIVAVLLAACDGSSPRAVQKRPADSQPLPSATPPITSSNLPALHPRAPLRVGGDVIAPVIIRRVDPIYPEYRGTYRQGILLLECVITEAGEVRDLRVVKGPGNSFEQAILDAVKQWKFKPGTLRGEPVPVVFNLTVNHVPYGPVG